MESKDNLSGALMVFLGVLIYAFDTLLIKLANTDGYTAGFWRGLSAFLCVAAVFPIIYRKKSFQLLKTGGFPMILSGILYGIGGVLYTNCVSIIGTSLSLILLSMTPIITSVFSILLLKEHPRKITWITMIICLLCIIYMFGKNIQSSPIIGLCIGIFIPIALSLNFVNLRAHPDIPRLGVTMIGGLIAAIICFLGNGANILLPFEQLRYLVFLGLIVIPIGQFLIMSGTKLISATETTLINSLECIIGMFYVFMFASISPSMSEIIGAIVILCSVLANVLL